MDSSSRNDWIRSVLLNNEVPSESEQRSQHIETLIRRDEHEHVNASKDHLMNQPSYATKQPYSPTLYLSSPQRHGLLSLPGERLSTRVNPETETSAQVTGPLHHGHRAQHGPNWENLNRGALQSRHSPEAYHGAKVTHSSSFRTRFEEASYERDHNRPMRTTRFPNLIDHHATRHLNASNYPGHSQNSLEYEPIHTSTTDFPRNGIPRQHQRVRGEPREASYPRVDRTRLEERRDAGIGRVSKNEYFARSRPTETVDRVLLPSMDTHPEQGMNGLSQYRSLHDGSYRRLPSLPRVPGATLLPFHTNTPLPVIPSLVNTSMGGIHDPAHLGHLRNEQMHSPVNLPQLTSLLNLPSNTADPVHWNPHQDTARDLVGPERPATSIPDLPLPNVSSCGSSQRRDLSTPILRPGIIQTPSLPLSHPLPDLQSHIPHRIDSVAQLRHFLGPDCEPSRRAVPCTTGHDADPKSLERLGHPPRPDPLPDKGSAATKRSPESNGTFARNEPSLACQSTIRRATPGRPSRLQSMGPKVLPIRSIENEERTLSTPELDAHIVTRSTHRAQVTPSSPDRNTGKRLYQPDGNCADEMRPCGLAPVVAKSIEQFKRKKLCTGGEKFISDYDKLTKSYADEMNDFFDRVDQTCISLIVRSKIPYVKDTLTPPIDDETPEDAKQKMLVKMKFVEAMENLQDEQLPKKRRGNLPKESTAYLKRWFDQHYDYPYPTDDQKNSMSKAINIGVAQISHWFINHRKRVWKPSLPSSHRVRKSDNEGRN